MAWGNGAASPVPLPLPTHDVRLQAAEDLAGADEGSDNGADACGWVGCGGGLWRRVNTALLQSDMPEFCSQPASRIAPANANVGERASTGISFPTFNVRYWPYRTTRRPGAGTAEAQGPLSFRPA